MDRMKERVFWWLWKKEWFGLLWIMNDMECGERVREEKGQKEEF